MVLQRQQQPVAPEALPPLTRPDVTAVIQCLQGRAKLAELRLSLAAATVVHSLKTCAPSALPWAQLGGYQRMCVPCTAVPQACLIAAPSWPHVSQRMLLWLLVSTDLRMQGIARRARAR